MSDTSVHKFYKQAELEEQLHDVDVLWCLWCIIVR